MNVTDYLSLVAYKDMWDSGTSDELTEIYRSNFDNSYITHVGLEDDVEFLADREITQNLTHGVGFSPKENKWYGWSHRAIFGFTIGSTCKKGDCHYKASTPEELIDNHANFYADISPECAEEKRKECQILPDRSGIRILHTPIALPMARSVAEVCEALEGDTELPIELMGKESYSINKCGKGEWVALTMGDAKRMAIDFNEGVS